MNFMNNRPQRSGFNTNQGYVYQTQDLFGFVRDTVAAICQWSIDNQNDYNRVTDARLFHANALSGDNQLFEEVCGVCADFLEHAHLDQQVNINNQRDVEDLINNAVTMTIPYVVVNYGNQNQMNIPAHELNRMRNDANQFVNYLSRVRRDLSDFANNNARNNGGFSRGAFGSSRNINRSMGSGNRWGSRNNMDANSVRNATFNGDHVGDRNMFDNSRPNCTTNANSYSTSSGDYFAKRRREYEEKQAKQQARVESRQAYHDLVMEDGHDVAEVQSVEKPVVQKRQQVESNIGHNTNKSLVRNVNLNNETFNYKPEERPRGVNWLFDQQTVTNVFGETIENLTVTMVNYPDKFKYKRERYAPRELYPIDIEELKWDNSVAYVDVNYPDGKTIREYVFTLSKNNPIWKSWDKESYRCVIELDSDFMPIQKFIPLTEEEKMDITKHIIPGSRPLEGIAKTSVLVRQPEDVDLSKQIQSLQLSDAELKKQEEEIIANGDVVDENQLTTEQEIITENKETLVEDVLSKVFESNDNPKLVEVPVCVLESTFTKKRRNAIIKEIKNCKTFDDYHEKVLSKLTEAKEYPLIKKLSNLIDEQYNKILVRLGILDTQVDDIQNYYRDVLSHGGIILPSNEKEYEQEIEKMFATLVDDDIDFAYTTDGNTPTYVGSNCTVYYINRLLHELGINLPDTKLQAQKWVEISKANKGEFRNLVISMMMRSRQKKSISRDVYFLTADGVLVEVISKSDLELTEIFVNTENCK